MLGTARSTISIKKPVPNKATSPNLKPASFYSPHPVTNIHLQLCINIHPKKNSLPLNSEFFNRPTLEVTRDLLGKNLCRRQGKKIVRLRLTEVEAYDGPDDKACHAHRGRTPRNAIMFGPPGYWYVYLCYGMHWLLNIVVGPENYPAAILIRGAGDIEGPGRLTRVLSIDKSFNHLQAHKNSGLWIEENGLTVPENEVVRTPRIGIDSVGPPWAEKPYRMVWNRN